MKLKGDGSFAAVVPVLDRACLDWETRRAIVDRWVSPLMDIETIVADDPTEDGSWRIEVESQVLWDVLECAHWLSVELLPERFSRAAYDEETRRKAR